MLLRLILFEVSPGGGGTSKTNHTEFDYVAWTCFLSHTTPCRITRRQDAAAARVPRVIFGSLLDASLEEVLSPYGFLRTSICSKKLDVGWLSKWLSKLLLSDILLHAVDMFAARDWFSLVRSILLLKISEIRRKLNTWYISCFTKTSSLSSPEAVAWAGWCLPALATFSAGVSFEG